MVPTPARRARLLMDMVSRHFPDATGCPIIWPRIGALSVRSLTPGALGRPKLRDPRAALRRESRPSTVTTYKVPFRRRLRNIAVVAHRNRSPQLFDAHLRAGGLWP